jgi:hypothetical protein
MTRDRGRSDGCCGGLEGEFSGLRMRIRRGWSGSGCGLAFGSCGGVG